MPLSAIMKPFHWQMGWRSLAALLFLALSLIELSAEGRGETPHNPSHSDDPERAPTIYRVEALAGQPFGIGSIRYRMCAEDYLIDRSGATVLTERNHRVFYPVVTKPAAAKFFRRILGDPHGPPDSIHTVWFLFRGEAPLELTLRGACNAQRDGRC